MLYRPRAITCVALLLFASACVADDAGSDASDTKTTGDTSDTSDASDTSDTGEEMTGEELYTAQCSACHGPDAAGTTIAYEIQHPHDEFAKWVVRNGRTSIEFANQMMPQFTTEILSDAELDLIIEYLDSFPQPDTPEGLYVDYCRNCHGLDANGGVVDASIKFAPIQDFIENTRQGRGGTSYGVRNLFMPARTTDELSDSEIQQIFDYVQSL